MAPTVLYDILAEPASRTWVLLIGFELLGIAAFCFALRPGQRRRRSVAYSGLWLIAWTVFFGYSMHGWYRQNVQAPHWARDGSFETIEGTVTELDVHTFRKRRPEVVFAIDDRDVFHSQGGRLPTHVVLDLASPTSPLKRGARVRVGHHDDVILKLEVLPPPPASELAAR